MADMVVVSAADSVVDMVAAFAGTVITVTEDTEDLDVEDSDTEDAEEDAEGPTILVPSPTVERMLVQ